MEEVLIFIAVHGAAFGVVLFALVAACGFLLVPFVRRLLINGRARRARDGLGAPWAEEVSPQQDKVVTLAGRLRSAGAAVEEPGEARGAAAATLEMEPTAATTHQRADHLWLEVGADRVDLDGDVEVILGTRELYPHHALPWEKLDGAQPLGLRHVAAGDRVRVRGLLSRAPTGAGDSAYRVAAPSRWVLTPDNAATDAAAMLRLVAERPPSTTGTPWPRSRDVRTTLAVGGVSVFVAFALMVLLGQSAVAEAERSGSVMSATVAAMTPHRRTRALQQLSRQLEARLPHDDAGVAAYLRINGALGRRTTPFDALMHAERFEPAAEYAFGLPQGLRVRRAANALGRRARFDASSRWYSQSRLLENGPHLPGWREEVLVHLLAGQPRPAAAVTAVEAANFGSAERCMADAMLGRTGQDVATGALCHAATGADAPAECRILAADQAPLDERLPLLADCSECEESRWARVTWLLRYEAARALDERFAEERRESRAARRGTAARAVAQAAADATALDPAAGQPLLNLVPGLERSILADLAERESLWPTERLLRARLAMSAARFDLLTGAPESARSWVGLARRDWHQLRAYTEIPADDVAAGWAANEELARDLAQQVAAAAAETDPCRTDSAEASETAWSALFPDPLAYASALNSELDHLGGARCPGGRELDDAVAALREGLQRRETAVLIDLFAAW